MTLHKNLCSSHSVMSGRL